VTSEGWHCTNPAEGVVRVGYRPGAAGGQRDAGAQLARLLETEEHRVVLAADIHLWPVPGPGLLGHRLPVVAALRGTLGGGALVAALAADIRIAADDLRLTFATAEAGLIADAATIALLVRLVGAGTAGYWILTRRSIDAVEARDAGLVGRVVPERALEGASLEVARTVASGAPIALQYAKEALTRGTRMGLLDALDLEADLYSILQTTEDRDEGVRAFLEKRDPSFAGR
jgi:enoyl-CoA hydratase/carnithine racemase